MGEHTPGPFVIRDFSLGDKAILDTTANYATVGAAYSKNAISGKALPAHANATLWAAAPDLLAALEAVEWGFDAFGNNICGWCHGEKFGGHAPNCRRQATIAKAKKGNET